jgi:hypothetical protein
MINEKNKQILASFLFLINCFVPFQVLAGQSNFNQIIGTQAIGGLQGCGNTCSLSKAADEIAELGSNMIKISITNEMLQPGTDDEKTLNKILKMPFKTYFFWWRSGGDWFNGFNEDAEKQEYDATFAFAKKLLTDYEDSEKTFFLGNWEGDWYLLQMHDGHTTEPKQYNADNMAKWLNIRQKAVNDAREQTPSKSKIYMYVELNKAYEPYKEKDWDKKDQKIRIVNAVLPQTNMDYVSYSSYDVQQQNESEINNTLDYIESQLKPSTANISGHRVFIGEMGMQARVYGYDKEKHEQANRAILLKFLKWQPPYILYWEIRNNEVTMVDGQKRQEGFWLIDDKDVKWPLWYTLSGLFKDQENQVAISGENSYPFIQQKTIEHLQ